MTEVSEKTKHPNRIYDLVVRGSENNKLEAIAAHAVWTEHDLYLVDETGFTVFWAPSHVMLYCAARSNVTIK